LARAALAEPFSMAQLESAQFNAERRDILHRAVYKRLVVDSAVVNEADIDSLKSHLAPGATVGHSREELRAAAAQFAQRRRAAVVDARVKAEIAPAWDDSVAALLVRAYAQLDPKLPDASRPFSLKLPTRQPILASADSGKVLAHTGIGDLTAAAYTRRFLGF